MTVLTAEAAPSAVADEDPRSGRLLAFSDGVYRHGQHGLHADQAFAVFLTALAEHCQELTIVGRLAPEPGVEGHRLGGDFRFIALPYYALDRPSSVIRALFGTVRQFHRALDEVDCVWLNGPHPHAVLFAAMTLLRRRRLVLGVRQDYPRYVRSRRPDSRWMHGCADALEWLWRRLARRHSVITVGPDLAEIYHEAPERLEATISLISEADIERGEQARDGRRYGEEELHLLSVGRLDPEKNPLLLVDVFALLRASDPRWRLRVCGEGALRPALQERLETTGLAPFAEISGYIPLEAGLLDTYRASHVFLHVSLTEGMPQVLAEAFASGLPVVATAVGGVAVAAGDAALLIPPNDAEAAALAVQRAAMDPELRERLTGAGFQRARAHTITGEASRVVGFLTRESEDV